MTNLDIEYCKTYARVRDFGAANEATFPKSSKAGQNFQIIADELEKVEASGALQESNIGRSATASKESAAIAVRDRVRRVNRTARSLAVDHPEIGELFRMPHGNGYQKLINAANAFYENSAKYEQEFIESGLAPTFRADLLADIAALQQAITGQNEANDATTGATGAVAESMQIMNKAFRRLRGIVPNAFENDASKLAAWTSASHVARPSKTTRPEPPPA